MYAQGVERETKGSEKVGMIRRIATIAFAVGLLTTGALGRL